MAGIKSSLLNKVRKCPFVHEGIDNIWTVGVIIEVIEIHLEKVHLLLHLLKDDLVVPIIARLHEDSRKEKFIQTTDLIHIHEDGLRFLTSDDLFVEQRRLEIRSEDA